MQERTEKCHIEGISEMILNALYWKVLWNNHMLKERGGGIKSLATNQTLFMNYVLKQWTKIVILQYHAGSSVQDSLKWKRYCDFDSNQAPFIALNLHFKENKKCHNSTVQRNEFPSRNRGQAKCESICDFDLIHTQPCVVVQSSIPLPQKKKYVRLRL